MKIPRKFRKLYIILSINLLNVVVFLFALNVAAYTVIKIKNTFLSPHSLTDPQVVYPGMLTSDISALLEETWHRPWQYEPWVGFKERPRNGKYVNISNDGFRHSNIKYPILDSKGINIFVFGGSTTFGYGIADESTIPSHLQKNLSIRYPNKNIKVFNFGRGYYYSTQELTLLLQLIRNNHIPTIAIFIDGLNEGQKDPHYTKEMSRMFEAYNTDRYKLVADFIEMSSLMKAGRKLTSYVTQPPKKESRDPIHISKEYLANKEIINFLAVKYNFDTYFFIQPVAGYRNNFLNHIFDVSNKQESWIQHMTSKMQLLDKTVDNHNSFSLTHLLENYGHQPFVDNLHYTSKVCDLIAAEIAQKINMPEL